MSAHSRSTWQRWTRHIHVSPIACSPSVWLHDVPFLHVHAHKWVWHGFDSPHGYTGREPDSGTIVMNSLFKLWSTELPLFFFTTSCLSPQPARSFFHHHFFFIFLCDGLVFSHWASTPLAAGAVRYRHSGICVETQIRGRPDISGQWAWDACNTKPVMEVSPQTDIDVPWDCMTQNKQTDTNMLVSAVRSWNVKMIRPRTKSYEGSHRGHSTSWFLF